MSTIAASLSAALTDRYRIERELGTGGMATVYLAEDVRHHRKVAIKVLHPELSAVLGPERFLKEIELTANLQHPHILPLFDSGNADGLLFYVMPYIEGETLRRRLEREQQLPIADALRIATEVADALEYAHKRGVVHRDIKPENILLHDGRPLVVDFGIALAVQQAGGARMTQTGMSLGTPQYMAPEQAMGDRSVDHRADIYALGAVTYEMLTGEPPFTGPNSQAIVAKVLTTDATSLSVKRRSVPAHVEDAVLTALEKMPADRQSSAAEFAVQLGEGGLAARTTRMPSAARRTRSVSLSPRVGGAVVATLVLGALIGHFAASRSDPATAGSIPSRLAIIAPSLGGTGAGGTNRHVAILPDGSAVIFLGESPGAAGSLWLQRLDEETPRRIPGAQFTYAPIVSPDGRWLAVRNLAGDPMVLPVAGAPAPPAPFARGLSFYAWHPDGSLWITRAPFRRIERYRPDTEQLEVMLDSLSSPAVIQQVLADGRTALVMQGSAASGGPLIRLDLRTGERITLVSDPIVAARYAQGHLLYAGGNGVLLAQSFNPQSGRVGSSVATIAQGVSVTGNGDVQFDVSSTGVLAYVPEEPRALVLVDRTGAERLLTEERHNFHIPRFSPDGRRIAVDFVTPEGRDVWVLDLGQQTISRTTFDGDGHDATWTPDGRAITYSSEKAGALGLYRTTPGSGAAAESLLVAPQLFFTGVWHPNGTDLLTVANSLNPGSGQDIAVIRNEGRGPLEPLIATRFSENYPALSPNGQWVAYVSDQSGRPEVYVRPWVGGGVQIQVSQGGGGEPMWSHDGRELFYHAQVGSGTMMMTARIETSPGLRVAERNTLFPLSDYVTANPHSNYDVAPDGRGFVMVRRNPASRIMVIQNLPALIARLVGGSGTNP